MLCATMRKVLQCNKNVVKEALKYITDLLSNEHDRRDDIILIRQLTVDKMKVLSIMLLNADRRLVRITISHVD